MSECDICCDSFNNSVRKCVTCLYCYKSTCTCCIRRYLLETTTDPHCMHCQNLWSREFLITATNITFVNTTYKNHRENILFEREKAFLPAAQQQAVIELERRKIVNKLTDIRNQIERLKSEEIMLLRTLRQLTNDNVNDNRNVSQVIRKCPIPNCRGFLSPNWICDLCSSTICKKCNELKTEDHECDPEAVETMKLLSRDTKPCPNCGTMIHKTSGCSQMWCPNCHVAFNWNNLRIETGVVHNPHYYEFQRNMNILPRNPQDIVCGGIPPLYHFRRSTDNIIQYHRLTQHMQIVEVPHFNMDDGDLMILRIKYLLNDISEKDWKFQLQKIEKRREKCREISDIVRMFVDTSSELFRQYISNVISTEGEFTEYLNKLKEYFNGNMEPIAKRYNCVTPYISYGRYGPEYIRRFHLK